ncbi:hypothetical protein EWB00_009348, partial [Schistosoma japonicum]
RLSNNELISTKNPSAIEVGRRSRTINSSCNVLVRNFPQSGLLYNSPNTETPNLPMFEMSSQTSITKDNFSSLEDLLQRSPKSSHFEKDELTENEGSLLVKQIVQSISDKSDDSWNTDSSENGSSKTPLVNSKHGQLIHLM